MNDSHGIMILGAVRKEGTIERKILKKDINESCLQDDPTCLNRTIN